MAIDLVSMILANDYTEESLLGGGAVVGKNVTISSIAPIDGGNRVTFSYTLDNGTVNTSTMDVKDGVSITSISVDSNNYLVCTMSDGTEQKAKINILDNVYTKTETDTLLLDKAEKNHNHDSAYASKDTEHEHSNKETLDKFGVNDGGKLTFNGDVVTPEAMDLGDYLKKTDAQNTYVEKETGKGLSQNDFTTVLKDAYDKAVEDSHTHTNKSVIDKFSESADGALLYDGKSIEADLSDVYKKTETYSQPEADDKFVAKESGKGLSSNDYTTEEKDKLASLDNYDDAQIKTQIQAVANGLMDSVGYSADYKSIDIIAKNGVKKSVDVAPIISHASITELSDVDTTNKATGKALVYNATTSKHEYADVSGTDEKVKMDASSDSKYLGELLDNITIANENGKLKVKKLDGQEVTITEINYLKGLTMNVMDLVNMFSNGGVKIINTPVATYAELLTIDKSAFIEGISYLVYVLADENHDNAKTTYLVDKDSETPTYFGFADSQRDFTTNPIDLATEITGKLGISNMDSDAIKALFTVDDTYKTETATNNAFSTHGAKALYDELLLAIGNKANSSDLTAHKDDANIHVSTEDRTKWDSAKTHADSAHAPSTAQANVIETVKVNGTVLTPSNKAVNIDLSDYAKTADIPTTLPANGGNADTVNNHTVETDVPTDAVFTDTIYDDTEVNGSIEGLSSNLDELSYSDNGIENLCNPNKIERGLYTSTDTRGENYFHYEIEVTPNEYYSRTRFDGLTDYSGYCFSVLDENKNCIVVFANNERTIQIPSNGAYLWLQGGESAEQLKNMKYMVVKLQTPPTDYKPYIPSVKMLATENEQQNTEAMDLKMLGWTVPSECPVQNYVDGNGVFHQRVGRVDLGSLDFVYVNTDGQYCFSSTEVIDNCKGADDWLTTIAKGYSSIYKITVWSYNRSDDNYDKTIAISPGSGVSIRDSSYTDVTTFKNAMKGVYLYYELATPITKTIDGNEAVEELSSNLVELKVSDTSGGKNLQNVNSIVVNKAEVYITDYLLPIGTYTISFVSDTGGGIDFYSKELSDGIIGGIACQLKENQRVSKTFTVNSPTRLCSYSNITATLTEIQIEEGTTATPYEPYIPSVKMLAEEVNAQNESLSDLENAINGLNDDNYWEQGTWNILGQKVDEPTIIRMKEKLILPIDYSVSLVNSNYVYEVDYYENGAYKNDTDWISGSIVIPNGQEFVLLIRKVDNSSLVPTERNAISVLPKNIGTINDKLKNDLSPKRIELQNVDERVTIQDNGSFIINGFAFVNLLVTFNETLPQWSNFVRLPRPKGGNVSVHCENSVILAIYSQDNLPGDCGTTENVASGTEIRLLVNYEVA